MAANKILKLFSTLTSDSFFECPELLPGCTFDGKEWRYMQNSKLSLGYAKTINNGITTEKVVIFDIKGSQSTDKRFIKGVATKNNHTTIPASARYQKMWLPILKRFRFIFKNKI